MFLRLTLTDDGTDLFTIALENASFGRLYLDLACAFTNVIRCTPAGSRAIPSDIISPTLPSTDIEPMYVWEVMICIPPHNVTLTLPPLMVTYPTFGWG